MPSQLPQTFENVLLRDQWFWQQNAFDLPLLSEDDQDRLMNLPNEVETSDRISSEWTTYGKEIAQALEQKQRWLEAQAYWFATAQLLTKDNQPLEILADVFNGIVKTGGYAVGMPTTTISFQEVVEEGLQSLAIPIQHAVTRSLLMIGTLHGSIFADLGLSTAARIGMSQMLVPLYEQQRIKGSHLLFEETVRLYSSQIKQLRDSIDTIIDHPVLEAVKGQRNKLLETLHKLQFGRTRPRQGTPSSSKYTLRARSLSIP